MKYYVSFNQLYVRFVLRRVDLLSADVLVCAHFRLSPVGLCEVRVLQLNGTSAYSHVHFTVLFSLTVSPASAMMVCHICG